MSVVNGLRPEWIPLGMKGSAWNRQGAASRLKNDESGAALELALTWSGGWAPVSKLADAEIAAQDAVRRSQGQFRAPILPGYGCALYGRGVKRQMVIPTKQLTA